ncbi:uncharacterized protein LOC62_01G001638 [Vanrija pseudolonga]|uniref:Uncharacterized protein n=1 Tax=Vanrija pseudolonga TaxID=143232 RepID=A0AAF0Y188_9TREE|nr:hypothetical protein LOC62_01G001638 [Vanrija pseudolonga]
MNGDSDARKRPDDVVGLLHRCVGLLLTPILTDALPLVFNAQPDTARQFLRVPNHAVFAIAAPAAYKELAVEISIPGTVGHGEFVSKALKGDKPRDCCKADGMKSKLVAICRYPKYARHVRVVHFRHPCHAHTRTEINAGTRSADRFEAWEFASSVIDSVAGVEELVWQTGLGIGGRLWKSIASLHSLRRLYIHTPEDHPSHTTEAPTYPRLTPDLQQAAPPGIAFPQIGDAPETTKLRAKAIGFNGLALGVGWENLEVLQIEGLSSQGARTIASHLQILSNLPPSYHPKLHSLSISTHFTDLRLCEAIGQFGALRTIKHLALGTTGTKLNAECLKTIIENSPALESLKLDDVEGRLDKNTWAQIESWPAGFKNLEIAIAESGAHHSWVLKHLASLHHVPMAQLTRFAVVRVIHPVAELPWPPLTIVVPPTQPGHQSEAIPRELLQVVTTQGRHLQDLCLDWWELELSDLEAILYACPKMRKLQVAVKSSVLDIVSMSAPFGNVPSLVELAVTSKTPFQNSAAKVKGAKGKKDADVDLPPFLAERVAEGDTTLVEVRDLRKFVRRLPNFRLLRWIGRHGKGEWRFPAVRKTTLVPVDFIHSAQLTLGVWEECQRDPPSFKFEDDPVTYQTMALEPPASPTTPDVPPLTRSTTWSSAASLASASTTTSQVPPRQRRPSSANGSSGSTSVLGLEWEALPSSIPPVPPLPPVQTVPRLSMPPLPLSLSTPKKPETNGHSRVRSQSSAKGQQTPLPVSAGRAPRERKSTKPGKALAYTPGSTMNDVTQKHVPGAAARKSAAPALVIGRGGATPTPPGRDEAPTPSDSGSDGWTVVRGVDGRGKARK